MKFRVTFKDPDSLSDAIREAVDGLDFPGLEAAEVEAVRETRAGKLQGECVRRWFEYGEYLEVEIDTDTWTCQVVPR